MRGCVAMRTTDGVPGGHAIGLVAVHHAVEPPPMAGVVDAVVPERVEQHVDVREDHRRPSMMSRAPRCHRDRLRAGCPPLSADGDLDVASLRALLRVGQHQPEPALDEGGERFPPALGLALRPVEQAVVQSDRGSHMSRHTMMASRRQQIRERLTSSRKPTRRGLPSAGRRRSSTRRLPRKLGEPLGHEPRGATPAGPGAVPAEATVATPWARGRAPDAR